MNEDELREEATTTVQWECTPMIDRVTFINGYITGAEPREKRIAELEEKISVLLSCKNCPENKGGLICEKEYENKCLTQKIKFINELQQENKELKADNDARKFAMAMSERVEKQLREENAKLKARIDNLKNEFEYSENYGKRVQKERHRVVNDNAELRDQLTKAKELLAKWVELFKPKSDTVLPTPIQVDTEQFLKDSEVEK